MSRISQYLIFFGLLCLIIFIYLIWQRTNPQRLAFNDYTPGDSSLTRQESTQPKKLIIEDLKIDLPIFPAQINSRVWQVSDKGVSFLSTSSVPGEKGNSILYGHNWTNILGKLTKIKPDQIIKIVYNDGSIKNFVVESTQIVSWKDTSILNQTDDSKVTIYTCTGFLDSKRFVTVAKSR